jgi:hypothetical protein
MLSPQSGQTRLRIAEIKLMSVFPKTANAAIMSLPVVAVRSPPNAQNLRREAARDFARELDRRCGLTLRIQP